MRNISRLLGIVAGCVFLVSLRWLSEAAVPRGALLVATRSEKPGRDPMRGSRRQTCRNFSFCGK